MADIRAGDRVSKDYWPPAVMVNDATDQTDITSTSFTAGSPEAGVGFTSPLTGRIGVCLVAGMLEQSAGNRIQVGFEVYEGTSAAGTLVRGVKNGLGVSTSGNSGSVLEQVSGNMCIVEGLTPGVAHYARVMHAVDGGTTNDVTHRRLIVFPAP